MKIDFISLALALMMSSIGVGCIVFGVAAVLCKPREWLALVLVWLGLICLIASIPMWQSIRSIR